MKTKVFELTKEEKNNYVDYCKKNNLKISTMESLYSFLQETNNPKLNELNEILKDMEQIHMVPMSTADEDEFAEQIKDWVLTTAYILGYEKIEKLTNQLKTKSTMFILMFYESIIENKPNLLDDLKDAISVLAKVMNDIEKGIDIDE